MTKKEREYLEIFESGKFPPKEGMDMLLFAAGEGRLELTGKNPFLTRMDNGVKQLKAEILAKKARIRARAKTKAKKKARA